MTGCTIVDQVACTEAASVRAMESVDTRTKRGVTEDSGSSRGTAEMNPDDRAKKKRPEIQVTSSGSGLSSPQLQEALRPNSEFISLQA